MSTLKEGSMTISKKGVDQIRKVLEEVIELEECFAHEVGESNCLHCNADLADSYLKEDE
jgi:hypothetical protein